MQHSMACATSVNFQAQGPVFAEEPFVLGRQTSNDDGKLCIIERTRGIAMQTQVSWT